MNVEKMTERVGDALNAAYARALHEHNTQTAPEHMLAALLEQERGIAPVSYTHLDVYKRQPYGTFYNITEVGISSVLQPFGFFADLNVKL